MQGFCVHGDETPRSISEETFLTSGTVSHVRSVGWGQAVYTYRRFT